MEMRMGAWLRLVYCRTSVMVNMMNSKLRRPSLKHLVFIPSNAAD
jgi:hypothetical protein